MAQREGALVETVDLRHLGRVGGGREREVCVTSGSREDLHLAINAAVEAPGRVGEGPIPMDEGVARWGTAIQEGEAAMVYKRISEGQKGSQRVVTGVRAAGSVVEVDLDLSPACVTVVSQPGDETLVVLLGREEVRMTERVAVRVAEAREGTGIGLAPLVHPSLLLLWVGVGSGWGTRHNRRLEMVGHRDHQVNWSISRNATKKTLRPLGGNPPQGP